MQGIYQKLKIKDSRVIKLTKLVYRFLSINTAFLKLMKKANIESDMLVIATYSSQHYHICTTVQTIIHQHQIVVSFRQPLNP